MLLFRSSLISALDPLGQHKELTKKSTAELVLLYKAALGDTEAIKELNKVTAENAQFVDDMANKYGQKLNPNMKLTTKQIAEATAAFDALDQAITDLRSKRIIWNERF